MFSWKTKKQDQAPKGLYKREFSTIYLLVLVLKFLTSEMLNIGVQNIKKFSIADDNLFETTKWF